jgi:hypothetical protein
VLVGLSDLGNVKDLGRRRLDSTRAVQLQGLSHESVPDGTVVRVLSIEEIRQIKSSESSVAEEDAHVKSTGIVELTLADLNEAAELGQGAPGVVEQIADKRVDDDIDATALGGFLDALNE